MTSNDTAAKPQTKKTFLNRLSSSVAGKLISWVGVPAMLVTGNMGSFKNVKNIHLNEKQRMELTTQALDNYMMATHRVHYVPGANKSIDELTQAENSQEIKEGVDNALGKPLNDSTLFAQADKGQLFSQSYQKYREQQLAEGNDAWMKAQLQKDAVGEKFEDIATKLEKEFQEKRDEQLSTYNLVKNIVLTEEGTGPATRDNNGYMVQYGLNQGANPDIPVGHLTLKMAMRFYMHRYAAPVKELLKKMGIDSSKATPSKTRPPEVAAFEYASLNLAINMGTGDGTMNMIEDADGDVEKLTDAAEQRYRFIATHKRVRDPVTHKKHWVRRKHTSSWLPTWIARLHRVEDDALAMNGPINDPVYQMRHNSFMTAKTAINQGAEQSFQAEQAGYRHAAEESFSTIDQIRLNDIGILQDAPAKSARTMQMAGVSDFNESKKGIIVPMNTVATHNKAEPDPVQDVYTQLRPMFRGLKIAA